MRNRLFDKCILLTLLAGCLFIGACQQGSIIYTHYEHVNNDGWERNDTIHFIIPPIKEAGTYSQQLMLRTNNELPFLGISVIVDQYIYPRQRKLRKRVDCTLVEKNGHIKGNGISCYQYKFNIDSITLNEGDSLHMYVMHYMKQENLPGVSDVGILITK